MEPHLTLRQILCDPRIRILLVDDRPHVSSLVRELIDSQPDMMVVGEVGVEGSTIDETLKLKPDLVVVNLSVQTARAIRAMKRLRKGCMGVKVILCPICEGETLLPDAINAGAAAVVFQSQLHNDLVNTIRSIQYL